MGTYAACHNIYGILNIELIYYVLSQIGRSPPKDRILRIIEHAQVNVTIYAILASLAIFGILLATIFLVFNVKYRNQR